MNINIITCTDVFDLCASLPDRSINCVVTSPPYFALRNYLVEGQIGLETTPQAFVAKIVEVFKGVWRVLRDDGTCWVNMGDSFSEKQLLGMPWRVAFALQDDGWILRSDIIWHKPNPMPESVTDRPTKSHEYVFMLTKSPRYWYDADAIREAHQDFDKTRREIERQQNKRTGQPRYEPHVNDASSTWRGNADANPAGRNKRTVWTIPTEPNSLSARTFHLSRVGADAVSYGMKHIVAPDCPVHGGLFDQVAREFCGEHANDELSRILRIDDRLAQEPFDAVASTSQSHTYYSGRDSWDSERLVCFLSAIDHNIETRKTGRAPATNHAYTPFVETLARTGDKLELLASFVRQMSKHESNILPDEMDVRSPDQIPSRTVDTFSLPITPDCICRFYHETSRDTSHFATFPQALIEPMILAGCPDKCCSACGMPWVHVVEATIEYAKIKAQMLGKTHQSSTPLEQGKGVSYGTGKARVTKSMQSLGFRPQCDCAASTVPGIVLDPFMGSGTTALVARRLGRNYIGCDLSQAYVDIANRRLAQSDPFLDREVAPGFVQRSLFT